MTKEITLNDVANNHLLFSSMFLKILDKDKQLVPLHLNTVQRDILQQMTDRTLILKGRQQGVSTLMQSLMYRLALTRTITGLVLSHDDRSTQAFRRMFTRFNDHMPPPYQPKFTYNNRTIISFDNTDSEIIVATANGTGNIGRGFSFSHIHFSEYAFIANPESILSGAIQSGKPRVVIESTANGTGNDFYDKVMTAHTEPDRTIWKLLFYRWYQDNGYVIPLHPDEKLNYTNEELYLAETQGLTPEQIKWRRYKILELGNRLFNQEYPETVEIAFLATGVGYFSDISHLKEQLTASHDVTPDESRLYVAGLDLGRNVDYTVLSIIDVESGCEVDLLRINNMSWSDIINRVVEKLHYWGVDTLWVENNNMGEVILDLLLNALEDINCPVTVQQINMNIKTKPKLVNQLHAALEHREINFLPDSNGNTEFYNFTAKQTDTGRWQFSAESGHDDIVMARIIAWHAVLMNDVKSLLFV